LHYDCLIQEGNSHPPNDKAGQAESATKKTLSRAQKKREKKKEKKKKKEDERREAAQ